MPMERRGDVFIILSLFMTYICSLRSGSFLVLMLLCAFPPQSCAYLTNNSLSTSAAVLFLPVKLPPSLKIAIKVTKNILCFEQVSSASR